MAALLVASVDWLSASDHALEVATNVATTHAEARRAAYPNPSRRVDIGPCVVVGCEGRLVAWVRPGDSLLPSDIRCDVAGHDPDDPHVWTADEWHALRRRMAGYRRLAREITGA